MVVLSFSDEISFGFYSGQHLGQQNDFSSFRFSDKQPHPSMAHEGNKDHDSKGQDVVPAILLDHAAKLGSTNLQIIRAVSLR